MPAELSFPKVASIPSGFVTEELRIPTYNSLPASGIIGGMEAQIHIPEYSNTFLDPSSTYLSIKAAVKGTYLPQRSPGISGQYTSHFITAISRILNYFNCNSWGLFQRYQVYANNTTLIEDVNEVGMLMQMLDNMTVSKAAKTSGKGVLEDPYGYPGHRFGGTTIISRCRDASTTQSNRTKYMKSPDNHAYGYINETSAATLQSDVYVPADPFLMSYAGTAIIANNTAISRKTGFINVALSNPFYESDNCLPTYEDAGFGIANGANIAVVKPGKVGWHKDNLIYREFSDVDFNAGECISYRSHKTNNAGNAVGSTSHKFIRVGPNGDIIASTNSGSMIVQTSSDLSLVSAASFYHDVEFVVPLIGALGAHNEKLFPLFVGPLQLRLTFASIADILTLDKSCTNASLIVKQMEFVGDIIRLSGDTLQGVLSALPVPMYLPIRVTSFAHSNEMLAAGVEGQVQHLIGTRRASTKAIFTTFVASAINSRLKMLEGPKYHSVNPNLGEGTLLLINNTQYPRKGLDPSGRPAECYHKMLNTMNHTQSAFMRPDIDFEDFKRTLYDPRSAASKESLIVGESEPCSFWVPTAEYVAQLGESMSVIPACAIRAEGKYVPEVCHVPGRNKFYLAIDCEHYSRRGFLSGVSTMTGSAFMNLVVASGRANPVAVQCNYFNYHDVILTFDLNSRSVGVKV